MTHPHAAGPRRPLFPVLLLCGLVLSAHAFAQGAANLTGTWQSKDTTLPITLVINGDGTGKLDDAVIKYVVRGDKLIVNEEGTVNTYTFSLSGNTMTVSGGDLEEPLTFVRQGGGASKGLGARRREAAQSNPAPSASAPRRDESAAGAKSLVGRWQSDEAAVQINENGTLTINGEPFRYSLGGNSITLSNSEGSMELPLQFQGDTFVVMVNGRRVTYRRVAEGAQFGVRGGGGGGANPPELFGKWCYMSNVNANNGGRMSNRCFTLYENGTYEYYSETSSSGAYGGSASQESDSGTWSVMGSTITANSRSQGTITYSLEKRNHPKTGDPMLVLDGDAYVTYSPRQPWP